MDQSHQTIPDDHAPPYPFYAQEQDTGFPMAYGNQLASYHHVVQQGAPPSHLQPQGMPHFHPINIMPQQYGPGGVYPSSPPHAGLAVSPPSPSPDIYDPVSPPISGSDTSGDGIYHHNSSGQNSPTSSRHNSVGHRSSHRFNPTPSPTSSSGRRSRGHSQDSEEDDLMHPNFAETLVNSRKEATRRQRIEAEQRRRDDLRDGYAKLKDVLPVSNQKSSKVSLLERATNHILALERNNKDLQEKLLTLEQEVTRLRALNEKISLTSGETPSPGMFNARPLSPPPDIPPPTQSSAGIKPVDAPSDESSLSEGDY